MPGAVPSKKCESETDSHSVQLFATLLTVAHQAPPSMGFSRQEYWSGLPVPSPGGLPNPGIFPTQESYPDLPQCRQTLYHLSYRGRANSIHSFNKYLLKARCFKVPHSEYFWLHSPKNNNCAHQKLFFFIFFVKTTLLGKFLLTFFKLYISITS